MCSRAETTVAAKPGGRVAVGGFLHESNSFAPALDVDFAYFTVRRDRPPLVRGCEVLAQLREGSFCLTGFLQAVDTRHTLVPLVWASGGAGGRVLDDAFEGIVGELTDRLAAGMPVDAVYLDLHGAMVTPAFADAEGELLRRVRAVVGDTVPIVATLDYHANVSPLMVEMADSLIAFRTYPHVDRIQTGQRAARVLERLLRTGRPAGRALRHAPFLVPLEAQCTLVEPSRSMAAMSRCDEGDVVSLSYAAGFPAGDTCWTGPAFFAHAASQRLADGLCDRALRHMVAREPEFVAPLWHVQEAVAHAVKVAGRASRPVILADIQDNPGAGASSDTTGILTALVDAAAGNALVGLLHDPEAAMRAHAAGAGASLHLALGGRAARPGDMPLERQFVVERLGDGRFLTTGRVAGGNQADLGPMALLRVGGVRVVVSSRRMQAFDPAPFLHLGIDVSAAGILVLKSTCHFRADFEPLAEEVLCVVAPGDCPADPAAYMYKQLRDTVRLRPGN